MYKILIALAMAIPSMAFAQHSIKGNLYDAFSNEPIPGAIISIADMGQGTISSIDGTFEIGDLSTGSYQLVISSFGYATRTIKFEVPLDKPLQIPLQPSAIEMEAVIVSTPFHRLQSENVVRVERETIENLSRSGAITLMEGVSQLPGVENITTGARIGKPVIRGLSSNRVVVYSQGVRMENQQYGDEHGLGISASGIESVEVIKGPASLLYGSDALGGVLYFNPEKYVQPDSSQIDGKIAYYSNTLGTEANMGYKTSGKKFKFLLRGNYAAHSDYQTGEDVRVTNSRFNETDIKTGIGFQDKSYRGDMRYNYNNSNIGIPEELGEQSTSKDMLLPYQQVDNHIFSLDNRFYFNNSSLDVKVGYLFNNRKEFEDHHHEHEHEEEEHDEEEHIEEEESDHPALEMHLKTLNYDVKFNFPQWGNFETIVGLQGMYQNNTNLGEEILIPDAEIRDIGVLATTHYHLEKLDFQAGLRIDNRKLQSEEHRSFDDEHYFNPLDRNFTSYNGALGVKIDMSPYITARVNGATGFRAPNLAELTANGSHGGTNRFEIGNPNLKNEQNFQLDVVLKYQNEHFELYTNGFYNTINNYIFLNPTADFIDGDPVFNYLQNDATLYGGEAGLHIHPHLIHWLHIESNIEYVKGQNKNGDNLPLIPATSINNTLRIELEEQNSRESYAYLTVKSVMEQNSQNIFETRTPGYTLLNAGLGGNLNLWGQPFGVTVSGSNILNKTYISHLSRLKADGIPNQGRNMAVTIQTAF